MSDFHIPADQTAAMLAELEDVEIPPAGEPAAPADAGQGPAAPPAPIADPAFDTSLEPAAPAAPAATAPAAPVAPVPGRTVSDAEWDQIETYRQLDRRLQTDPNFARQFQAAMAAAQAPPPPPPPAPPTGRRAPDGRFDADPAYQSLVEQLQMQREAVARHEALLNRQHEAEIDQVRNTVATAFKARHSLDDTTYQRVYEQANQFAGAMPGMHARGLALDQALDQVLETAYWSMADMREAETARVADRHRQDQARKAKAGSLSGSSGSVPRVQAPPSNPSERRAEMIDYVNQALNGTGTGTGE
jgi:hypothetical protein